jgi:hypothetical protein
LQLCFFLRFNPTFSKQMGKLRVDQQLEAKIDLSLIPRLQGASG